MSFTWTVHAHIRTTTVWLSGYRWKQDIKNGKNVNNKTIWWGIIELGYAILWWLASSRRSVSWTQLQTWRTKRESEGKWENVDYHIYLNKTSWQCDWKPKKRTKQNKKLIKHQWTDFAHYKSRLFFKKSSAWGQVTCKSRAFSLELEWHVILSKSN